MGAAPKRWSVTNGNAATHGRRMRGLMGATGSGYTIEGGEVGDTLRAEGRGEQCPGCGHGILRDNRSDRQLQSPHDTVVPSITGTPRSGQTLTANAGSWQVKQSIGYTYQWEGATARAAVQKHRARPPQPRPGQLRTSATRYGSACKPASETLGAISRTSAATRPIAGENDPIAETSPAVSGTGLKGNVLTATTGAWSGLIGAVTYTYQWERCGESGEGCSAISGATTSTYTLTESDVASTLRLLVTATDERGSTAATSLATAVIGRKTLVNVAPPSITGPDEIGQTLSAEKGIWTGEGSLAYDDKWERCNEKGESCNAIPGATASSYTPSSSDVGKTLKIVVTAEGTAGKESVSSAATPVIESEPLAPTDLFAPSIEGNLTSGETLTAQTGMWVSSELISYSYQWQKCNEEGESCANITGATSSTYKLIEEDVKATLRVFVTAKNSLGTASAGSEASEAVGAVGPPKDTSRPIVNGAAKLGERLTAGNGNWSGSRPLAYYYRWERCNTAGESCSAIEGATNPSYTTASTDVGSTLRVKVTTTNSLGSAGAISTQTLVIAGSEASATSAIELAEKTDPSVLQPATPDTIEGQEIKPADQRHRRSTDRNRNADDLLHLQGNPRRIRRQHTRRRTEHPADQQRAQCSLDAQRSSTEPPPCSRAPQTRPTPS